MTAVSNKKVRIWTDPKCLACAIAKRYLELSNIPYEERDISEIPVSECRFTPVLEIEGKRYCGFTPEALKHLDKLKG